MNKTSTTNNAILSEIDLVKTYTDGTSDSAITAASAGATLWVKEEDSLVAFDASTASAGTYALTVKLVSGTNTFTADETLSLELKDDKISSWTAELKDTVSYTEGNPATADDVIVKAYYESAPETAVTLTAGTDYTVSPTAALATTDTALTVTLADTLKLGTGVDSSKTVAITLETELYWVTNGGSSRPSITLDETEDSSTKGSYVVSGFNQKNDVLVFNQNITDESVTSATLSAKVTWKSTSGHIGLGLLNLTDYLYTDTSVPVSTSSPYTGIFATAQGVKGWGSTALFKEGTASKNATTDSAYTITIEYTKTDDGFTLTFTSDGTNGTTASFTQSNFTFPSGKPVYFAIGASPTGGANPKADNLVYSDIKITVTGDGITNSGKELTATSVAESLITDTRATFTASLTALTADIAAADGEYSGQEATLALTTDMLSSVTLTASDSSTPSGTWAWAADSISISAEDWTTADGTTTVTKTASATYTPTDTTAYKALTQTFTFTITDNRETATVTITPFSNATVTVAGTTTARENVGQTTTTSDTTNYAPVYSSDNESVATVDSSTGAVTIAGPGYATITACAGSVTSVNTSYKLVVAPLVKESYTWTASDYKTYHGGALEGTAATINGLYVDAISGKFTENGNGYIHVNTGTKIYVPVDETHPSYNTITLNLYDTSMTFTAGTDNATLTMDETNKKYVISVGDYAGKLSELDDGVTYLLLTATGTGNSTYLASNAITRTWSDGSTTTYKFIPNYVTEDTTVTAGDTFSDITGKKSFTFKNNSLVRRLRSNATSWKLKSGNQMTVTAATETTSASVVIKNSTSISLTGNGLAFTDLNGPFTVKIVAEKPSSSRMLAFHNSVAHTLQADTLPFADVYDQETANGVSIEALPAEGTWTVNSSSGTQDITKINKASVCKVFTYTYTGTETNIELDILASNDTDIYLIELTTK
ncbi:MAG: hypothetical protein IJ530_02505 [Treponema sp.]|uniref:hypothetical protein n=1 Tax=Treponema sp. TaxID=166 RepID=UPI0025DFE0BB|nr:hypothetical protein [Treponema sp.]MBQ8678613.1 hypothetical protein [Treponema sp.]MBR1403777.1 hypothetical protein [Treponema sp.]